MRERDEFPNAFTNFIWPRELTQRKCWTFEHIVLKYVTVKQMPFVDLCACVFFSSKIIRKWNKSVCCVHTEQTRNKQKTKKRTKKRNKRLSKIKSGKRTIMMNRFPLHLLVCGRRVIMHTAHYTLSHLTHVQMAAKCSVSDFDFHLLLAAPTSSRRQNMRETNCIHFDMWEFMKFVQPSLNQS